MSILVIGDIILDEYIWGEVTNISPEAPIPVLNYKNQTYNLGGAANVANNIKQLRKIPYLIGLIGSNHNTLKLFDLMKDKGLTYEYLVTDKDSCTIKKTRFISSTYNQQLLRLDTEKEFSFSKSKKELFNNIERCINENKIEIELIVVSDYNKGVVSAELMSYLKTFNLPIYVDPHPNQNVNIYKDVTLIKPNIKEAYKMANKFYNKKIEVDKFGITASIILKNKLNSNILITSGKNGMLYSGLDNSNYIIRSSAKQIYDVTGAGDTVIAALAVAHGFDNYSFPQQLNFANIAAGIVVGKLGTATASLKEIEMIIKKQEGKIIR